MRKFIIIFVFLFTVLFPKEISAHCPLCVAGAGVGISLSKYLGIDDSITGVWIGAFLGAVSFWTVSFIRRRWKLSFLKPLIYLLIFISSIWSFYSFNLVNKHAGDIFGIDKLTFGIVTGGLLFYFIDIADDLLIKKKGKVYFPYQRIIVSLGSMAFLSFAIYILINYYI